jgi:hypothetical protein
MPNLFNDLVLSFVSLNIRDEPIMQEVFHEEKVWLKPAHDFRIQRCAHCNEEMEITEGSVIFGERWYHNACWKSLDKFS